ncbi:hypothetical protein MXB_2563, partial [Myxobolus squamalis]
MKSVYAAPEPWIYECVKCDHLISLKPLNITGVSNTLTATKVLVKYLSYDILKINSQTELISTDINNSVSLKIGQNGGMNPLCSGSYIIMMELYAFTADNSWALAHETTLNISVTKMLVVESFFILPNVCNPAISTCCLKLFNHHLFDCKFSYNKRMNCIIVFTTFKIASIKIIFCSSLMCDNDSSMLWVGTLSKFCPELNPQESFSSSFSIMLLKEGIFNFDVVVQTEKNQDIIRDFNLFMD